MRLGKFKVVHQTSFLQMAEDDAIVEFEFDDDSASFIIKFASDADPEEKPQRRIEGGPDPDNEERGLLTFYNWGRPGAASSGEPMTVLTIEDGDRRTKILMLAFVQYANRIYSVNLQFMMEVA
ncbi:hypothetical protein [Pseudomonas sp. 8O]|uniref:hypothetical protein n=1 Tax=Pseudomonas sp. 8O TaxID=2653165 RepID=UPI00135827CF|nr:hypothetical protein [Pseudomonas sp. 8O]